MESGLTLTWEYKTLVDELIQGMEKANQLRFHLGSTTPSEARDLLLQRILSSYEKALMILKWSGKEGEARMVGPSSGAPEPSISVDGSPTSEDFNKRFNDNHHEHTPTKKRKNQPTWTEQVRVNSNSGFEGPTDDGYSWRKYGQKDILGAKYPRSYYRCTYRLLRSCWATKQVQRSDDDPSVFEITYKGSHTCNHPVSAVPPPPSPEKQELKHNNSHNHQLNQTLLDLKSNLRVVTENLDNKEMTPPQFSFPTTYDEENHYFPISSLIEENQLSPYSPLLLSQETSESNYFSPVNYQMKSFGGVYNFQHSECEIISAHASTTNSPIGGMEFSVDHVELDPNFPFNTPEFFT
ncbi:hypothetical protein BUALT_Bualt05G0045500 [Buddleja alternifolia]|uniref:WRKY domain-containing protein n=1 Tax=Buddleja alternifolia TaxID=168488 RepID=A0AAV6XIH2_9LAMI|nr:hypothetical protein BUALT_Bualt05G0045500 [Buddleja alternifolia]